MSCILLYSVHMHVSLTIQIFTLDSPFTDKQWTNKLMNQEQPSEVHIYVYIIYIWCHSVRCSCIYVNKYLYAFVSSRYMCLLFALFLVTIASSSHVQTGIFPPQRPAVTGIPLQQAKWWSVGTTIAVSVANSQGRISGKCRLVRYPPLACALWLLKYDEFLITPTLWNYFRGWVTIQNIFFKIICDFWENPML